MCTILHRLKPDKILAQRRESEHKIPCLIKNLLVRGLERRLSG